MSVPLGLGVATPGPGGVRGGRDSLVSPFSQLTGLGWLSRVPVLGELPAGYWLIFLVTLVAAIVSRGTWLFAPKRACVGKIRTRLANASVANASVLSALVAVALVATTTLALFAFGLPDWGRPPKLLTRCFTKAR